MILPTHIHDQVLLIPSHRRETERDGKMRWNSFDLYFNREAAAASSGSCVDGQTGDVIASYEQPKPKCYFLQYKVEDRL